MTTGFMGIEYSTDEIKNGRFVDGQLERDFLQTRYDILRQPGRKFMVDESMWRKNGEDARKHFLRMMEESNKQDVLYFKESDEPEQVRDAGAPFTYDGGEDVPKNIETVIIASEVEEIPDETFKDCTSLKSIVFNENLHRIGKKAFENCPSLTNVRLIDISYIGDEAFQNCNGLLSIELGPGLQHIGMGAFKNCSKLGSVWVPPNLTFMGDFAFANCAELTNVTVMDGVVEVSAYAFQNCTKLEKVMLPTSVEKVSNSAFENCPHAEICVPTLDMEEAEEILNNKMVAKAEEDDTLFKCCDGNRGTFFVRLYKDLY